MPEEGQEVSQSQEAVSYTHLDVYKRQEEYNTYIFVKNGEVEDITCDCPDYYNHYGVCKHTLATVLELSLIHI